MDAEYYKKQKKPKKENEIEENVITARRAIKRAHKKEDLREEAERMEEIKEKLKQVSFSPYETTIDVPGIFSNEKLIRVVWVGLEDEITKLLQEKICAAIGFQKEKEFVPHITLARVKHIPNELKKGFVEKIKQIKIEAKSVQVTKFLLIKSELGPEGPRYETLAEYQ